MKHELTTEQLEQVKQWKPEWFITELKNGKWYAHKTNGVPLLFKTGKKTGYGFNGEPNEKWWCDECDGWSFEQCPEDWREATEKEVQEALINEAKRRGLIEGTYWLSVATSTRSYAGKNGIYSFYNNKLYFCNGCIFNGGKWAEPLSCNYEPLGLSEDIQALKDKYTDYNFTIIAEKRK